MHLKDDELLDLAEGTRTESSAPHLMSCAVCRQQLADLRATLGSVVGVDVPEPSPLFWNHLSRRVQEAVAAQDRPGRAWLPWLFPASALAAVLAFVLVPGVWRMMQRPQSPVAATPAPARETLADVTDPSLILVADLAETFDADAVAQAGLTSQTSAEQAVTRLTDAELRELRRLLQAELAHASD